MSSRQARAATGFAHSCLDSATDQVSALRSVWSEPTVSHSVPACEKSTGSTSPELPSPTHSIVSACVSVWADTR